MLFYHQNAVSIHQTFDDQKDLSAYLGFPALVFQIFVAQKDKNSNMYMCIAYKSSFLFQRSQILKKYFCKLFLQINTNIEYCYIID